MKRDEHLVARDLDTGLVVASRVTVATRRIERAVGLLGRSHLEPGEALLIAPCHGVHMWFMRFPIDIIAMDKDGVVVDAVSVLKPWRMRLPKPGAYSVLELPAGTLASASTSIGHRFRCARRNSAFEHRDTAASRLVRTETSESGTARRAGADAALARVARFPAADEQIERQIVNPARQQQPGIG